MGLFSRISERIFGRKSAPESTPAPATGSKPAPVIFSGSPQDPKVAPPAPAPIAAPPAAAPVDVEAVLSGMADDKGGKSDWRHSIVDLLKLLDLDSSLDARKELAAELEVNAGAHGSAEQNLALHRAVMRKLAENGGKVPDSLKD
ncbi:DUF3597 domain-containing protein [Luteimonas sp. MJ250]|jgi:hypothetical protein|uniref:DUF3597 domain-containing protein n=1 Tax=Luteimonas sp. MJ250 TaxID=3129236 RepID=UPI0031BAEEFC